MRNCSEDSCLGTERDKRGRRRMLENMSMWLVMRILMMMMSMNNLDDVDVNEQDVNVCSTSTANRLRNRLPPLLAVVAIVPPEH